jgi:hypothetical protein
MRHHRIARLRAPERAASRVKMPFKTVVGTGSIGTRRKQLSNFKIDIWAPHQLCAD